jgi:hypothetical protein
MQLGGALELNKARIALALPPLTLISADQELIRAALGEGILTDDPNSHP